MNRETPLQVMFALQSIVFVFAMLNNISAPDRLYKADGSNTDDSPYLSFTLYNNIVYKFFLMETEIHIFSVCQFTSNTKALYELISIKMIKNFPDFFLVNF